LAGETFLTVGDDGGRGREGGLGSTGEVLGNGRILVLTERVGVTGVGLIVLGAVNDLFWEGAAALGAGGCLKETR
jgi:hypothetical protein